MDSSIQERGDLGKESLGLLDPQEVTGMRVKAQLRATDALVHAIDLACLTLGKLDIQLPV